MTLLQVCHPLRMPILPSDVPANRRDVVTMAGKAFWDLATQPPDEAEADFKNAGFQIFQIPQRTLFLWHISCGSRSPNGVRQSSCRSLESLPIVCPPEFNWPCAMFLKGKLDQALKLTREAVALSPDL